MKIWEEFKTFVARGSFFDLAVGIMVGAAFSTVVNSLVDDVLMPPIGMLTSGVDVSELYLNLSGGEYASLAEATEAGAVTIDYGAFVNNVLSFLIVAAVLFLLVRKYNRLRAARAGEPEPGPEPRHCPYCRSVVDADATRCPHCTSELQAA